RTAAFGGRLGAPVRHRPPLRILGQGHPLPAQPRRRPPSRPRLLPDRDHPAELLPADSRLRRPAGQRRPVEEGNHPLSQALRRPRGLPPPAPARGLTLPALSGTAWPSIRLPHPCWPANDPPAVPGAPGLLTVT